jgi:hypothetical protein
MHIVGTILGKELDKDAWSKQQCEIVILVFTDMKPPNLT